MRKVVSYKNIRYDAYLYTEKGLLKRPKLVIYRWFGSSPDLIFIKKSKNAEELKCLFEDVNLKKIISDHEDPIFWADKNIINLDEI